jgi:ATP-dependent RNA helicase RhlE
MSFEGLGLDPKILSTLHKLKYNVATPIQVASIPAILAGDDLLGCAQTGTGKTAAFSLPILQSLFLQSPTRGVAEQANRERSHRGAPRRDRAGATPIAALVLTPTRELANQVGKSFSTYGRGLGLRQAVIYGGVSQNPQISLMRSGVDIVVATPGRLLDLMGQGVVDLSQLKILVLDEADQMLDMGFIQPLKRIVSRIPRSRQTLMFSATMPPEIQKLAEQWLNNPRTVQANVVARPPDKIEQSVAFVEHSRKAEALIDYLRRTAGIRQIVFCRTKHGADRLAKLLERAKIPALAIHGNKSQNARERALASFSSETPPVLVATDVAARGLHMPGISHVINYDLPHTPETYVHRIGRTARAGAAGESISFCSADERPYLRDIEKLIGRSIAVQNLPGDFAAEPAKQDTPKHAPKNAGRKSVVRAKPAPRKSVPARASGPSRDGQDAAGRPSLGRRTARPQQGTPSRPKQNRPPSRTAAKSAEATQWTLVTGDPPKSKSATGSRRGRMDNAPSSGSAPSDRRRSSTQREGQKPVNAPRSNAAPSRPSQSPAAGPLRDKKRPVRSMNSRRSATAGSHATPRSQAERSQAERPTRQRSR